MTKREQYIANVKKGIELLDAMQNLKNSEKLTITIEDKGTYDIRCWRYDDPSTVNFSISSSHGIFGQSMNVDIDNSSKVALHCYSYDLFNTRTSAKLQFEHITLQKNKSIIA